MSVAIHGTNGVTFNDGTLQATEARIVQVVQATQATNVESTSASYVATGLTLSLIHI